MSMEREKEYRKQVVNGYVKSPELLSRVIARALVWHVGAPEHLDKVRDMITDIDLLVGDNIMVLCDDIAKRILEYATSGSEND